MSARYDGVCVHCKNLVFAGEQIVYDAIARHIRHPDCTIANHRPTGDGVHPMYKPNRDAAIFSRLLGGN